MGLALFPSFKEGRPRRFKNATRPSSNRRGRGGQENTERQVLRTPSRMAKRDLNSNTPPLKARRRELRNNPTPAEAILWRYLRPRQILGKKFGRQFSIGRFIVDFFCVDRAIAIELDGVPHFREVRAEYDAARTAFLQGLG